MRETIFFWMALHSEGKVYGWAKIHLTGYIYYNDLGPVSVEAFFSEGSWMNINIEDVFVGPDTSGAANKIPLSRISPERLEMICSSYKDMRASMSNAHLLTKTAYEKSVRDQLGSE